MKLIEIVSGIETPDGCLVAVHEVKTDKNQLDLGLDLPCITLENIDNSFELNVCSVHRYEADFIEEKILENFEHPTYSNINGFTIIDINKKAGDGNSPWVYKLVIRSDVENR